MSSSYLEQALFLGRCLHLLLSADCLITSSASHLCRLHYVCMRVHDQILCTRSAFDSAAITGCHWPIKYCYLPIKYCYLPIKYCYLPINQCHLPINQYHLPIRRCLLAICCCNALQCANTTVACVNAIGALIVATDLPVNKTASPVYVDGVGSGRACWQCGLGAGWASPWRFC